ncbi:NAD(P)H-binding protein [Kineosporia rhizophila]|uniref:SDR family oxidoreductase n=1 Tax=Kineosporia rhizophila TaxID=84633 RepID=UPI001E3E1194|nr:NAD(P)H-binding protein [Kineosporia rhizophila]MCE0533942.1 NAD(P)H-binding protein [Kineosporia rhizophila]
MKVVVLGGSGLVGSQVVGILGGQGHEVLAASPSTGVNTLTGEGVEAALAGAEVVVDVTNTADFSQARAFFTTSTVTLLKAAEAAGVKHLVALSIVGVDTVPDSDSGYLQAKVAQEQLIEAGAVPYTIVRATQFFEFAQGIAGMSTGEDGKAHLSTAYIQPIAASEVARIVAEVAVGQPRQGHVDIAGPQRFGLDEYIRLAVPEIEVVTDESAGYAGVQLQPTTLVPVGEAVLSEVTLAAWQEAQR